MPDTESKSRWEAQNVIQVAVKINRNQDPDLFELISKSDSRSGLIRDLLRQAVTK